MDPFGVPEGEDGEELLRYHGRLDGSEFLFILVPRHYYKR